MDSARVERVAAQRDRILKAMGIVKCVAGTDMSEPEQDGVYVQDALLGVFDLLDSVCSELDPCHFEQAEPSPRPARRAAATDKATT